MEFDNLKNDLDKYTMLFTNSHMMLSEHSLHSFLNHKKAIKHLFILKTIFTLSSLYILEYLPDNLITPSVFRVSMIGFMLFFIAYESSTVDAIKEPNYKNRYKLHTKYAPLYLKYNTEDLTEDLTEEIKAM